MKYFLFAFIVFAAASCNNSDKIPDVSNIKIDLKLDRFENDFFSIDTNNIDAGLDRLHTKYPLFFQDFMGNILGIDNDMIRQGTAKPAIIAFIRSYKTVYDSCAVSFRNFSSELESIKKGLQFVIHYFPQFKPPATVTTFIGPIDASYETSFGVQGDILTADVFGIGLQLHLGKDFPMYKTKEAQSIYPEYISKQFEPDFIAVNVMKNIVDDLFPVKSEDYGLVQQMVEKGKRLYLLSKFLPYTEEHKLIGYTAAELQLCRQNEAIIWELFTQNNLLQSTDKNIIKNYIGESPKTQEIVNDEGKNAPGNIGSFAGWQIVKKFMSKKPSTTLAQLMGMDPEVIYQESKYKP